MKNADMPASKRLEAQSYVVDSYGQEVASTAPGPLFIRWRVIELGSFKTVCDGLESSALARSFAAAPVLAEALEGLLNALPSATTHPAIKAARAALAALEPKP